MNGGASRFEEADDSAYDFGGAQLTEAKEFAQRLDPAAAEAYADYLTALIERMSELAAAYVKVGGALESWQSEAGDLCAAKLVSMVQHAVNIRDIATETRAVMLEASGIATQTRNRTADLDDWQVPYTLEAARRNDENMHFATDFRDDLDGALLRTTAVLGTVLAAAVGVTERVPARGALLTDPYRGACGTGSSRLSPASVPTSSTSATSTSRKSDPLARTPNPARPVIGAYAGPAQRTPSRDETPATAQQIGVFGEFGFDDKSGRAAASAAPQQLSTDWMSAQDTGGTHAERWRAPVIGDPELHGPGFAARATGRIISARYYEPPADRDWR